ncbi:MAG: hypothetical protein Q8N88_00195, partial [Nanoarchaeota archaeon]|nr:hypothetical protein [Nanoarchaeota archaeon]
MKKEIVLLMFIFYLIGVFAMDESIIVKTASGNHVKLYAWTAGGGPLLVMNEGDAINNSFVTTFFSLSEPTVKFHVIIINEAEEKIRDNKFDNQRTSESLIIDCNSPDCTISVYNESAVLTVQNGANVNVSDLAVDIASNNESNSNKSGLLLIGKLIFIEEDGSIKYEVAGGSVLAVIVLIFLVFFFKRKKRVKNTISSNSQDKELEIIEEQIRQDEEELKGIKEVELRRLRLAEARRKLAKEEKEIKLLRRNSDSGRR